MSHFLEMEMYTTREISDGEKKCQGNSKCSWVGKFTYLKIYHIS